MRYDKIESRADAIALASDYRRRLEDLVLKIESLPEKTNHMRDLKIAMVMLLDADRQEEFLFLEQNALGPIEPLDDVLYELVKLSNDASKLADNWNDGDNHELFDKKVEELEAKTSALTRPVYLIQNKVVKFHNAVSTIAQRAELPQEARMKLREVLYSLEPLFDRIQLVLNKTDALVNIFEGYIH